MQFKFALFFALAVTSWTKINAEKEVGQVLLTSVEVSKLDEDWREDIKKASEPYFSGKGEDSTQVVDFYSKWLRKWIDQNLVDKPRETLQDWQTSFKSYYDESKAEIDEFLRQQYARYHERFDNAAEAMEALQAKATDRLKKIIDKYEEEKPKLSEEDREKLEALFTSVDLEDIDKEWREEVRSSLSSYISDKAEDASEAVEFYSKFLRDWLKENFVEKPRDSWQDWKTAFKSYYEKSKPKVEEFFSKQYNRANEGVENAKEKMAEAMDLLEMKATDRLEQLANKFPPVAKKTRIEL